MSFSRVVLKTSKILLLDATDNTTDSLSYSNYQLKWRFGKLWVRSVSDQEGHSLPAFHNLQWLKECLEHSPVNAVCLDPNLGEEMIRRWADACEEAGKAVFLRLPSPQPFPKNQKPGVWRIKRVLDWLIAVSILVGLSPVLATLALLVGYLSSDTILIKEWAIGHRGKLFRLYRFNIPHSSYKQSSVGRWIQKCGLDKLPQLIHVVNGDMSLVGIAPYLVNEIDDQEISSFWRILPGITGTKQIKSQFLFCNSKPNGLSEASSLEERYLMSWTLRRDLKFFLVAIPKALTGFSSY